jgi:hypothetical protein
MTNSLQFLPRERVLGGSPFRSRLRHDFDDADLLMDADWLMEEFIREGLGVGLVEERFAENMRSLADTRKSGAGDAALEAQMDTLTAAPLSKHKASSNVLEDKAQALQQMGAMVYLPEDSSDLDWSSMAGYEEQKRAVEEIVLMSITHAHEFAEIVKRTRKSGKSERAKVQSLLLSGLSCPHVDLSKLLGLISGKSKVIRVPVAICTGLHIAHV